METLFIDLRYLFTLGYGIALSAAFAGVTHKRDYITGLIAFFGIDLAVQSAIATASSGINLVTLIYPLETHVPLTIFLVLWCRRSWSVSIGAVLTSYLCCELPNVVGIKQANGDLSSVAQIAALCDIDIYSGNDDQIVPILSLGGKGVLSVLSNVAPRETHDICAAWFAGDPDKSRRLQLEWLDLANALFSDVNPIPVKEALNLMGKAVGDCRLPLYPMEERARAALASVLEAHHLR